VGEPKVKLLIGPAFPLRTQNRADLSNTKSAGTDAVKLIFAPAAAAIVLEEASSEDINHGLANEGYDPYEPRLPAGQPGGGQWTTSGGESDINEAIQEKLWSINNPKYRAAIVAVARSHEHDKTWLRTGEFTNKCNLVVADWIYEATGSRPLYKGRAPLAYEWADPKVKIEDWSPPFPVSEAQPGDVIAQNHGGQFGHVGIVVAPGLTASADATVNYAVGIVTIGNFGFRPTVEANGGPPGGPMPVVRRYVGY